jgi:hypothetical protein
MLLEGRYGWDGPVRALLEEQAEVRLGLMKVVLPHLSYLGSKPGMANRCRWRR